MKIAMTAADLLKWIAYGNVTVTEIFGFNNQAADLYIQLHEVPPLAAGTLTAGAVPTCKSLLAQQKNGFKYSFVEGSLSLSQLLVAVSTTEANYTAVGANGGLDMTIVCTSAFLVGNGETVIGDLTTAVASLEVWADGAGPQQLLRVTVTNNAGADKYLQLFAKVPVALAVALQQWLIPHGTTQDFWFRSPSGISPYSQDANGTGHVGCELYESTTSEVFTAPGANDLNIRAIYRAS